MVDVRPSCIDSNDRCDYYGQFTGNKSSLIKSGKRFTKRIINIYKYAR